MAFYSNNLFTGVSIQDMNINELNKTVPLMTLEAFSEAIGMTLATLRAQVYRGYWPTLKIGKKVFINLEAVRLIAIQKYNELPR